jgi:hypothetical protein
VFFCVLQAAKSFLPNRSSSNLVHILDPRYPRTAFFCLSKFVAVVEIRVRIAGVQYKIAQIKSKMGAKSFLQEIMTWNLKHKLFAPHSTLRAFLVKIRCSDARIRRSESALTADIADFAAISFLHKISIWNLKHMLFKAWPTLLIIFNLMRRSDAWIRRSESAVTAAILLISLPNLFYVWYQYEIGQFWL